MLLQAQLLSHPQAQQFLVAIEINTQGQVDGLDSYCTAVAHLGVTALKINDGVFMPSGYSASSGRACQALTSSMTESVTAEISAGETSVPYISSRWL